MDNDHVSPSTVISEFGCYAKKIDKMPFKLKIGEIQLT
jgi:hypothetical protein